MKKLTVNDMKKMRQGSNVIVVDGKYSVMRTDKTTYRLHRLRGKWSMLGTAEEVIDRLYRVSR